MKKKYFSSDKVKISYDLSFRNKKRPLLVFLHGLGGNSTEWKYTLEEAKKRNFSTLLIDLRGHGFSDIPEEANKYTLECYAKDLRGILEKEKIKNYAIVGHSFGGVIAIIYCTIYKDLQPKGLVLIETTYKYPYKKNRELNVNPIFCWVLRHLVYYGIITNKVFSEKRRTFDANQVLTENIIFKIYDEIYHTAFKVIFDSLDATKKFSDERNKEVETALKSYKGPILIIGGKTDNTIPLQKVRDMRKLIPNSKLEIFDGGHLLPLEDPKNFNLKLFNFLMTII